MATWSRSTLGSLAVRRELLPSAKQQPPDLDSFVTTSYGVAAARLDEQPARPAEDADDALFEPLDRSSVLEPRAYTGAGANGGPGAAGGGFFSTSMLSKQPNDCCMDEAFQRCGRKSSLRSLPSTWRTAGPVAVAAPLARGATNKRGKLMQCQDQAKRARLVA